MHSNPWHGPRRRTKQNGIVTLIVLARKGPHGAQVSGNRRTKLEEPAPYALVGNIQTPLRKEILHISIAQSEPGIEPNGASNDFRWKAVTFEGDGVHPQRLHRNHQIEIRALNVTMPSPRLPGRQELQRPADPRGLHSRLPALSLLKAIGVYSTGRTSEAARNRLMEPPLKSRFRKLGHLLKLARSGRSLFAPRRGAPLIENCRARPDGDMPSGGAPTRFRADRENGSGLRHVLSLPAAGPGLCRRKARARALRSPLASVTRPCLCRPGPFPAAGGAFLPRQGLGVFRHSRVSEKRSQTLNSLGGKT